MAVEASKNENMKDEEVRHTFDDEKLAEPSATYADITNLICEAFLKIAVQYCHANMEYNVVHACLKGEFYNGTLTCRNTVSQKETTVYDLIFSNDTKVSIDDFEYDIGRLRMQRFFFFLISRSKRISTSVLRRLLNCLTSLITS